MALTFAKLVGIENDHGITGEKDGAFLFLVQDALLLALRESGSLNEMQYRRAAEKLKLQQRRLKQK